MRRVAVFGTTGSGKSWLAERLAEPAGLRVVELDALYWPRLAAGAGRVNSAIASSAARPWMTAGS